MVTDGGASREPAGVVVPGLCLVHPVAADADTVLRLLARRAHDAGYVHDTFERALLEREQAHPTGLPTPMPTAIPHADVEHVRRAALAAALLDPAVPFEVMGGTGDTVDAQLVVLMLVTDPRAQVGLLSQLVTALQRPDLAEALAGVDTPEALASTLHRLIA